MESNYESVEPNKQDSPHLFSMAVPVIYTVSLHLCDYLSLEQKINEILSEF